VEDAKRHGVPVRGVDVVHGEWGCTLEGEIEGVACVRSVSELPAEVQSLSIITPPQVTDQVVEQAIARGVRNIWMQPGAQSAAAIAACEQAGVNVIADGSCVLVVMGYHEH
jgi:predicted CoA-binding protein